MKKEIEVKIELTPEEYGNFTKDFNIKRLNLKNQYP